MFTVAVTVQTASKAFNQKPAEELRGQELAAEELRGQEPLGRGRQFGWVNPLLDQSGELLSDPRRSKNRFLSLSSPENPERTETVG